jgi:predicted HTH transcriptional regulator
MPQKRTAFLFGADGPEAANLKPLQYAQNDIRHLKTAFSSSSCNFHQVADAVADTASILLTQLERFAYTCERPDLLVVHFSGHGFVWNGQLYLLCNTTDVDAKLFNSTAINIMQIKTILDQCSAKHKLLILDCCFAGIAHGVGAWKSEEQLPGLESLKGSVNAILAACPAHRRTRELDTLELYREKGAGFLSWAIARACDEQFTQVAREDALSLSDILNWLPGERENINKSLSPEERIPVPRILNEHDLVGDDEIWFTSRRRSSSDEERMIEKRQLEEHALFQHASFLLQPCPTARTEDFDAERVIKYAQHDGEAALLPLENLPRLCQQLGLTSTIGTPTIDSVLAFHKAPSRHIHSALIRATRYLTDERDRYVTKDIQGPLGKQVEDAFCWLLDNLHTISEHVGAGKRVDRCEIPGEALRELIANAVVHRDYEANESIQIKITPRQVTITNPGRLNAAIMNNEPPFAYRESHPRNPFLLTVLAAEDWAEGRSRGFEVVMEEFRKYNLALPEISNLPNGLVQVVIIRPELDELRGTQDKSFIRHNLPNRSYTQFIGREAELAKLEEILSPSSRYYLISLNGIGGAGKTTIALEIAYRFYEKYNALPLNERFEAIVWVSAKPAALTTSGIIPHPQTFSILDDLYLTIARVLELPSINMQADLEQRRGLIEHALTTTPTLLIIDNLETVDDEQVLSFLSELPHPTKAIVTTRRRIDFAYAIRLTGMPHTDALALIELEAQHKNVKLPAHAAEELFQRTGSIPLAIVWSIALMSMGYDVESVLRRLGSGHSDIARFCFDESMALIRNHNAYRLFLALALFESRVSRKMLGEVSGIDSDEIGRDDALAELLQLSLINQEGDYFTLLPLTRSYALDELAQQPELERMLREQQLKHLGDSPQSPDVFGK